MSLIQFQVKAATFLSVQRNALRSLRLCPPPPTQVGTVQLLIDRIEFGNNALRHDVPDTFAVFYEDHGEKLGLSADGFKTQLAQDVTVYVTTLGDVLAHPNGAPATVVPVPGTIVSELFVYALDDECYLRVEFDRLEPGPLPVPLPFPVNADQILQMVQAQLRTLLPSPTRPLGLAKLLPKNQRFLNAGLSVDGQLQRLEFRVQIGGSSTYLAVPWSNFFRGFLADRLDGSAWSLFVEAGLVTETVKAVVNEALASAKVDHLKTYVGCAYSNAGGKAVFTLDVLGIYELPDPLPDPQADPTVPFELSVSAPNTLTIDADFTSVIGLIDDFVGIIGAFLPFLAGPLHSLVHELIGTALSAAADAAADAAPVDDCKVVGGSHIRCSKLVPVSSLAGGAAATLTRILAQDDGVALAGSLRTPELTPAVLQITTREFKWNSPRVTCGPAGMSLVGAFVSSPKDLALLHADAYLENGGTAPLYLCATSVINDGLGVFPIRGVRTDSGQAPIHVTLDMPVPSDAYYALLNPYPCDLLVRTTGGTRLLRFSSPPMLRQTDIDRLVAVLLAKIASCEQLVDPWFRLHRGYNPHWSVDPPFGRQVDHLWQIELIGVRSGETAALVNAAGEEIARATAQAHTPLHLSAMLPPGGERELTIMSGRTADRTLQQPTAEGARATAGAHERVDLKTHGIVVGQQQLVRLGSVHLPERGRRVQATHVLANRCVVAVLQDSIVAYDLAVAQRPVLAGYWQVSGLRGALTWQTALLVYGDFGFGWIDSQGRRPGASGCEVPGIVDAAVAGDALYALTDEALEVYSPRLCRLRATRMEGARSLAITAGKIVIGGPRGVSVHDPVACQRESSWVGGAVTGVARPLGVPEGSVLATLEDGSARLLRVTDGGLEEAARFPRTPWFVDAARVGDLLVTLGGNGATLDIRQFGATGAV